MSNKWYRLDNAAKLYPAFADKRETGTFRVAALLKEEVNPHRLQTALNNVIDRYPNMKVQLRKGLFWYYFIPNPKLPTVVEETKLPCTHINNRDGYLFNVLYFRKRIALECFHVLTDGYGAFEFLKTLLYEYIRLGGKSLERFAGVKHPRDICENEEIEDSYRQYAKKCPPSSLEKKAHRIKGTIIPYEGVYVHHLKTSSKELAAVAKSYNTTITVLLAAIYIESLADNQMKHPINLTIPVNLRKRFQSNTLRNFTYVVSVSITREQVKDFNTIIKVIHQQLQDRTTEEYLLKQFSHNVLLEDIFLFKIIPSLIKNKVIKLTKKYIFDKRSTSLLSNPGIIKVPDEMKEEIDYMEFFLYSSKAHPINMGVCTFHEELVITLSRIIQDESIVTKFKENFTKRANISYHYYSN